MAKKVELEGEWFSSLSSRYLNIIHDGLANQDLGITDLLKMAVKVAFGGSNGPEAASIENHLQPMCRRCIQEADGRTGSIEKGSPDLPLWTFLTFAGWAFHCAISKDRELALEMAFNAGQVWGEIESKFLWKIPAEQGEQRLRDLTISRETNNRERAILASHKHSKWQAEAAKVWRDRPSLSRSAVAKYLAANQLQGWAANTIRQHIKKPDGAG
jgi:hypothetical protein